MSKRPCHARSQTSRMTALPVCGERELQREVAVRPPR
jgi:hypothetical protein